MRVNKPHMMLNCLLGLGLAACGGSGGSDPARLDADVGLAGGAGGTAGGSGGSGGTGGTGGTPRPGPDLGTPDAGPVTPDAAPVTPADTGTPPDAAGPPPPLVPLALNEVDCHGRDWVELYNPTDAVGDLSGYGLTDDLMDADRLYRLPPGTTIPARGFLALRQQDENDDGFQFGIGCAGGESIALVAPAGDLLDAVALPALSDRYTWGRLPDGTGDWTLTTPTRGEPNVRGAGAGAAYFDPMGRTRVELELPQASLDGLSALPYEHVPARVRLTPGDAAASDWYDVGVHIKGRAGSFRTLDAKAALRIDVNRLRPGQDIDGLKNVTLNNMVQDQSIVHEAATYALFRDLGIPAPRVGYAWVTVNGADYGLYLFLETYDDVWLSENFADTAHLYEGLYGQDLYPEFTAEIDAEEGEPFDRADYTAIILALNEAEAFPGELLPRTEALIDWDQVTLVMATELYVGHWDGYASTRNNWYMHLDLQGVMRLLPWGVDQTWGYDHPLHEGSGRLFRACLADLDCRTLYDTQLGRVLEAVDRLDLPTFVQSVYAAQRPALEADPRKEYPVETGDSALVGTVDFMNWRRAAVGEAITCLIEQIDPDGDGFSCDQDCGPDDPTVYPGAEDLCGDGIDQDCNGRPDDALACPDCQERFLGPHRYLVCPNARDFAQAEQHCRDNGAQLAQIDSAYENIWLWYNAATTWNQWWWIGGSDTDVEGTFAWTTGNPLTFRDFLDGQPDGGDEEDCLHYFEWTYQWNDISCGAQLGVLCEDTCAPGEDEDGDGHLRCGDDCWDSDPNVHPGAEDTCGDQIDQNCDGVADEGQGCDCVERFLGPHRYVFCHNARNWFDARSYCQSMGMDLPLVDVAGENTWLAARAAEVRPGQWWLGHTDLDHEGSFLGWDGREHWAGLWGDGEPNNAGGNEHCAHLIDGSDRWNDIPCDVGLPVICEETCPDPQAADTDGDGVTRCAGDCDDANRQIRPGAREICGDGLDQDCSGVADDGPRCR
jgi:hypothetical protein